MSRSTWTVAFLFAFAVTVRSQQPSIVKGISPAIKVKGDAASLACTVSFQQKNKVVWVKFVDGTNDLSISADTDISAPNAAVGGKPKFEVSRQEADGKVTYTLVVNQLTEQDTGTYICMIKLEGVNKDQWPNRFATVMVLVPPTITFTSPDTKKDPGMDVTFTCKATGTPTPKIYWIRADGMPFPGGKRSLKGSPVKMTIQKKDDRGFIRCVADNKVKPPATRDIDLSVFFKPEASPVDKKIGQARGKGYSATLKCRIDALPEAEVEWIQSRRTEEGTLTYTLTDTSKYQYKVTRDTNVPQTARITSHLTIKNVEAYDYGQYSCKAKNRLGSHVASVKFYETDGSCDAASCRSSVCSFNGIPYPPGAYRLECASCGCEANPTGPGQWHCVSLCPRGAAKPGCRWAENPNINLATSTNCCAVQIC